jgi:GNAT superfamily N-acetyltransferase
VSDYEISLDSDRFDVEAIHAYLSQSYWAANIPLRVLRKAIANSLCVGAYAGSEQVGFARLVTDRATFAYLADVYVLEAHRGHGLSRRLVAALVKHPELQGLRRLMLVTRDAHGLYEKFGFTALAHPSRVMELHRPDVYASKESAP